MEVTDVQYKESEIGVIPVDWNVKKISDFSKPVRGGSPRPAGSPLYFNGDYIPWLTVAALTNISSSQIFVSETEGFLTQLGSEYSRTLEKDTLIIANSGATLGVAKLLAIKCCANDGIAALNNFSREVDKAYVVYYINSITQKLREVVATGNGQPNLNTTLIGDLRIPLPPTKSEQTAIATALSDTDALIENLEKLIAKKRNIKQGVMQELLKPRNGWGIKKLGDFIRLQTGFPFSSEYFSDNPKGQRLIKNRDLRSDDSIVYYSGDYAKEFIVQNDDLLIGMDGDFEPVLWKKGNALLNQRVGRVLKIKEISIPFLSFTLLKELKEIEVRTSSTTVKHLSHFDINKIEMPLPNFEKQNHIATILTDMDADIYALEKKLNKIKQIKQGMMQTLLTGKIRLV